MRHPPHLIPLTLLILAHGALVIAAEEAPNASTSGGITEISVERTRCNGPCPADTLVLYADGKAKYTGKANTLLAGEFAGNFGPSEFDRLARWLVTEGFFQLGDRYPNEGLVADSHQVIRITRHGEQKSVTSYLTEEAQKMWAMGRLIRSFAADIRWEPANSGIRGRVLLKAPGEDWRPQPEENIVVTSVGKQDRRRIRSDEAGRFEINLAPGTYTVSWIRYLAAPLTVVVEPERFSEADMRFDADASSTANQ